MKKTISTIFTFLMIVVLVAGCAAPATAPRRSQAAEPTQLPAAATPLRLLNRLSPLRQLRCRRKEPVTLSYLVSQGWAPDAEMALAKQFDRKNRHKD